MTNEVQIRVTGTDGRTSPDDAILQVFDGRYQKVGSTHCILYDRLEENGQTSHHRIKLKGDTVELIQTGAVNSHMIFKEHNTHAFCYAMPEGELAIETRTKTVLVQHQTNAILVRLEYSMYMGGAFLSDNTVEIEVTDNL